MLRNMATIFLFNKDQLLMLKRSSEKEFNPNVWSVIGGHIESHEWKNPLETALREISEEIGFEENDLFKINLRYILLRKAEEEIRTQYVFVAQTNRYTFQDSKEGKLHWISKEDILSKNMTITIHSTLRYYLDNEFDNDLTVGIFDKDGKVIWSKI